MEPIILFAIAGAVLVLGYAGEWIFSKTKIPSPLWLMAFGIILGRIHDVSENPTFTHVGTLFTTFALIFILFEGVLNTNLKDVLSSMLRGGSLTVVSFVFSSLVVTGVMMLFGWGFLESLLLGIVLCDSAQVIIVPLIKKIKINSQAALALTFESAFSDVLCITGAVAIIKIITLNSATFPEILRGIGFSFLIGILAGIIGGLVWSMIHQQIEKYNKSYIITIGALLLLYSGVEYVGASGALACLAFGIVVGNSKQIFEFVTKRNQDGLEPGEKFFFSEISFFVESFFFVYIGLMMNLENPLMIGIGFLLTVLLFMARPLAVAITSRRLYSEDKDRVYLEILFPKGLSAAVLAMLPLQYGISNAQQFSTIVLSVITFSILFCVIFIFLTERGHFKGVIHLLFKKNHRKQILIPR